MGNQAARSNGRRVARARMRATDASSRSGAARSRRLAPGVVRRLCARRQRRRSRSNSRGRGSAWRAKALAGPCCFVQSTSQTSRGGEGEGGAARRRVPLAHFGALLRFARLSSQLTAADLVSPSLRRRSALAPPWTASQLASRCRASAVRRIDAARLPRTSGKADSTTETRHERPAAARCPVALAARPSAARHRADDHRAGTEQRQDGAASGAEGAPSQRVVTLTRSFSTSRPTLQRRRSASRSRRSRCYDSDVSRMRGRRSRICGGRTAAPVSPTPTH